MTTNQAGLEKLRDATSDIARTAEEGDRYLQRQIEQLAFEIKRLEDELRHSREREADARERLRLELENRMLRESRQLPPATEQPKKDDAE